jgi:hypothetical protein
MTRAKDQLGDYERVAQELDVRKMIADVTPKLLGAAPEKRTSARVKTR